MRNLILIILLTISSLLVVNAQPVKTDYEGLSDSFILMKDGQKTVMVIDSTDAEVVEISAKAFCSDVNLVIGQEPEIVSNPDHLDKYPIIAGTIGQNKWIDQLVKKKKIPAAEIVGQWESYLIAVVDNPFKKVKKALIVAGSDRRGTAYGIFELSKMMGVSPWVYWADVKPEKRKAVGFTSGSNVYHSPSVKFRGIFLNDEDWGLQPWAAKHHDTDIKDIGPNTYAKIFELLLRLKANFLWPAMHPCTKAFYYYSENPVVADKYAIVVGSSHCEPLLRNNVFEWKENFENEYKEEPKAWRYDLNKEQIFKYWDDRAQESSDFESVYTIGMRGIHDGKMPGPKDTNGKIELLNKVIDDQRGILENRLSKPANQIPQIFCPYKEVLTLYQRGIDLPEDVTIVWADDNHGYIRQLSTPEEQKRSGGSGVYYHVSYWGAPHDYLWLSSISPSLISFELSKAYEYGADKLWVINVGDIKPAELEMEFAMDLAWNVDSWKPEFAHLYIKDWAQRTFGSEFSDDIYDIKMEYYRLAQAAKPEHMSKVKFSSAEAAQRITEYQKLASKAEDLKSQIPEHLQDAYFELIYYPVIGAKLMNEKILFAKRSLAEMQQGKESSLDWASKSEAAFKEIVSLTEKYNKEIAGGKWDEMMDWKPRNLDVYKMPKVASQQELDTIVVNNQASLEDNSAIKSETINACKFSKKSAQIDGLDFIKITGIGINGCGVTVNTQNWYKFKANEPIKEQFPIPGMDSLPAPHVEYSLELDTGEVNIDVIAMPTHSVNQSRKLRYAISVNGENPQVVDLYTKSKSKQWIVDVLRGYHKGTTKHQNTKSGDSAIRIYFLDPGLVINNIVVNK